MSVVANFLRFSALQKILKSVKIWRNYRQFKGGNFLRHSVHVAVVPEQSALVSPGTG